MGAATSRRRCATPVWRTTQSMTRRSGLPRALQLIPHSRGPHDSSNRLSAQPTARTSTGTDLTSNTLDAEGKARCTTIENLEAPCMESTISRSFASILVQHPWSTNTFRPIRPRVIPPNKGRPIHNSTYLTSHYAERELLFEGNTMVI